MSFWIHLTNNNPCIKALLPVPVFDHSDRGKWKVSCQSQHLSHSPTRGRAMSTGHPDTEWSRPRAGFTLSTASISLVSKTQPCSTWLHIFDAHPYPKAFLSGTHAPLPSTFTSNSRLTPFKRGQKEQKWSSLFHYLKCLKSFIYLLLKIQEAPFYL